MTRRRLDEGLGCLTVGFLLALVPDLIYLSIPPYEEWEFYQHYSLVWLLAPAWSVLPSLLFAVLLTLHVSWAPHSTYGRRLFVLGVWLIFLFQVVILVANWHRVWGRETFPFY